MATILSFFGGAFVVIFAQFIPVLWSETVNVPVMLGYAGAALAAIALLVFNNFLGFNQIESNRKTYRYIEHMDSVTGPRYIRIIQT